MTDAAPASDKQAKRDARDLRDQARGAFVNGDYRRVRELDAKIVQLVPGTDVGREASVELNNLKPDPVAIYIGLGSLLLYCIAWAVSL